MNISRRFFLGGIIAVAAGQLIKPVFALPVIRADGIHDDTAGLNALLAGEPFHVESSGVVLGEGQILGGRFKITDTLILHDRVHIEGSTFIFADEPNEGGVWMDATRATGGVIQNCMFTSAKYASYGIQANYP